MKLPKDVAQKMKRSIKDFFIKIDQIFIQWGFIYLVGFDFNLSWGFWLLVTDTKSYFALE